jgi:hypothetical protein
MYADAKWMDVTIRNVSSRGMLLESSALLQRGTYLEVRRGSAVIVARAVWSDGRKVGLRTQDIVLADHLIKGSQEREATSAYQQGSVTLERRSKPRPAQKQEHSRYLARTFEFAAVGAFAGFICFFGASLVYGALARPAEVLSLALP